MVIYIRIFCEAFDIKEFIPSTRYRFNASGRWSFSNTLHQFNEDLFDSHNKTPFELVLEGYDVEHGMQFLYHFEAIINNGYDEDNPEIYHEDSSSFSESIDDLEYNAYNLCQYADEVVIDSSTPEAVIDFIITSYDLLADHLTILAGDNNRIHNESVTNKVIVKQSLFSRLKAYDEKFLTYIEQYDLPLIYVDNIEAHTDDLVELLSDLQKDIIDKH